MSPEAIWNARRESAAHMTAECPGCGHNGCRVIANFMQATRAQPVRFLGYQGLCPDCGGPFTGHMPFAVDTPPWDTVTA